MEDFECDLQRIREAVTLANSAIFDRSDATNFLVSKDLQKDSTLRLISWLICLDIVPPSQTASACSIADLYRLYAALVVSHASSELPERETRLITCDVTRSLHWFKHLSKQACLDENDIRFAGDHSQRVLRNLSLSDGFFKYTQGYDRYAMVSYLLALQFTVQSDLPATVAEAIAYYLAEKLLRIADLHQYLDGQVTEPHFALLDAEMRKAAPDTWKLLASMGHNSIHFALKWKLLLFADEHDIYGIWYLWDNIIVWKNDIEKYLTELCIAHLMQVSTDENKGSPVMLERIQKWNDWDNVALVECANTRTQEKKRKVPANKWYNMMVSLAVLIVMIAVLYDRFKDPVW